MTVLALETSCDETAVAILRGRNGHSGSELLASEIASQIAEHGKYGGIVPEIASRNHLVQAPRLLERAAHNGKIDMSNIDAFAATSGPGLASSLMVGASIAKGLAVGFGKPYLSINHLEGHLLSPFFSDGEVKPNVSLIVSGGHTMLIRVHELAGYELIGRTVDDAAGEAFDKVAKLLGLGYPGGPVIDQLAPHGNPNAVKFPPAQLKHRDRRDRKDGKAVELRDDKPRFDFSYSGIKTAILRYVETHDMQKNVEARRNALLKITKPKLEDYLSNCDQPTLDLVASFQRAIVDDLVGKTLAAAHACEVATLFVTGGVAANQELRKTFEREGAKQDLPVFFPSRPLSTDNAAMIAAAAYPKFLAKDFAAMDFSAEPGLLLR
jgi:N6-L-threonylcarbamoyladenine synthase